MTDSVNNFRQSLSDVAANPRQSKVDLLLEQTLRDDPDLHAVMLAALTTKDSSGNWEVANAHLEEALTASGHPVGASSIRRWRRKYDQS